MNKILQGSLFSLKSQNVERSFLRIKVKKGGNQLDESVRQSNKLISFLCVNEIFLYIVFV